ncbi:putative nuclease HARBI1 [Anopheles ziemanni]|uniref:putative nuclease HARBI1 n=1 Tax=Anopheles coustani TaxID=139045 RepID=UPI0026589C1B|nr:putative nuclease HARBI1 [Anopheles coustani]XP_058177812.1 putative nuclease HARBI1 [Anopheles ziemanni]
MNVTYLHFIFQQNFRISKDIFMDIVSLIGPHIAAQTDYGLTEEQKLAACLRYFGEGRYQHGTGKDFHVAMAQSTFSKVLRDVLPPMQSLLGDWIKLIMTEEERIEAKEYFFQKSGLPDVVMCVDGTHIKIKKPKLRPLQYMNRKKFYSINAMIVCDHKNRIRAIDARFAGSHHDAHIWRVSPISKHFMDRHRNGFNDKLLGDAGYPAADWLITPYRDPDSGSPESEFNRKHSSGRMIVERTIGLLKSRFRCLLGVDGILNYEPQKCAQIINNGTSISNLY